MAGLDAVVRERVDAAGRRGGEELRQRPLPVGRAHQAHRAAHGLDDLAHGVVQALPVAPLHGHDGADVVEAVLGLLLVVAGRLQLALGLHVARAAAVPQAVLGRRRDEVHPHLGPGAVERHDVDAEVQVGVHIQQARQRPERPGAAQIVRREQRDVGQVRLARGQAVGLLVVAIPQQRGQLPDARAGAEGAPDHRRLLLGAHAVRQPAQHSVLEAAQFHLLGEQLVVAGVLLQPAPPPERPAQRGQGLLPGGALVPSRGGQHGGQPIAKRCG